MAAIHATTHCHMTTPNAHNPPISRRIDATAATHGAYNRLNTNSEAAETDEITALTLSPKRTLRVETTLSFARNPLIKDVQILQSPKPIGRNNGTSNPATAAKMLSSWLDVKLKCKSKLCKNHITTVAMNITENAR